MADQWPYLLQNLTKSHKISLKLMKCHRVLQNLIKSCQMSPYLIESHKISPLIISLNLTESHQVYQISPYILPNLTESY